MCDICERIEIAKRHRDWAIESCRQHGDLQEAQKKERGYDSLLRYLYSLRWKHDFSCHELVTASAVGSDLEMYGSGSNDSLYEKFELCLQQRRAGRQAKG